MMKVNTYKSLLILLLCLLPAFGITAQEENRAEQLVMTVNQLIDPSQAMISDYRIEGHWAAGGVVPLIFADHGHDGHGERFVAKYDNGDWFVAFEGSFEFRTLLEAVPDDVISADTKAQLDYLNESPDGRAQPMVSGYKLPWPAGSTYYVTRAWASGNSPHCNPGIGCTNAVDVSLGLGATVVAMKAGRVTNVVSSSSACGCSSANTNNLVTIDHGNGEVTQYLHIATSLVTINQDVSQGQPIATSGQVGYTCGSGTCGGGCPPSGCPGPHLHFHLLVNGVRTKITFDDVGNIEGGFSYTSGNDNSGSCCGCTRAGASISSALVPFVLFNGGGNSSQLSKFLTIDHNIPPNCASDETQRLTTSEAIIQAYEWKSATDEDGEVVGYRVYWGEDTNGTGDMFVTEPRYLPTERVADNMPVTRYLRISAEDNDGNTSAWQTVAVWEYDPVAPTGTIQINTGGEVVPMLGVDVRLDVQDEGSGVTEMRLSADGETWQDWEPFVTSADWTLNDTPAPQTIYAQVRDAAGNLSAIMSASVAVDLSNDPPSSASYSVNCSTMTQGGSQTSSSSYSVRSSIGQTFAAAQPESSSYEVRSGFWGCVGDTTTVPTAITLQRTTAGRSVPIALFLGAVLALALVWWRMRQTV